MMTLFLTGSPCKKGEDHFTEENGFRSELLRSVGEICAARRRALPRILLVSAAPDDKGYNHYVFSSMRECIDRSGIAYSGIQMLERKKAPRAAALLKKTELLFLCGGHVPTQNRFFEDIRLRELLKGFEGVIVGCSAGSMNCADIVYSHPELRGEGNDRRYNKYLKGLALTNINLIPHLEDVRHAVLDGKRLFEDIIFQDSWCRRFYAIPDGAYVICRDGRAELRGESWLIADGGLTQTSAQGGTYSFMNLIFNSPHFPPDLQSFLRLAQGGRRQRPRHRRLSVREPQRRA